MSHNTNLHGRARKGAKGAVACGHPETAQAACEVLEEGGNAFDAAIAATWAAAVAEPVFFSLGGGGFLLARCGGRRPVVYDFFVETPLERRPTEEIDFFPIFADFGTARQEFHIGLGAAATPGAIRGLFEIHRDLASLPMPRLVEPAVRMAREGLALRPIDAYVFRVVGPILTARSEAKRTFTLPDGELLGTDDRLVQPELADTIEALAREGAGLFYDGDLGSRLVAACREDGGHLTAADLAGYRVIKRRPFERRYRGVRVLTNPPPSSGGILIAFALALLAEREIGRFGFGSPEHLLLLARVMTLTNKARIESCLHAAADEAEEAAAADRLFDPGLLAAYARQVSGHPHSQQGTTHISIIDRDGNIAAASLSNGEGCGTILPGTGIMLNNMLGEEDLHPRGFHNWPRGSRLSSMMAPTLALMPDGAEAALGSGGSNRIRTAILQVLVNLIDFRMPVHDAVNSPRLHVERGAADLEVGFSKPAREAVTGLAETCTQWDGPNLFFGGVHAVTRSSAGALAAAGDSRRGGAALVAGEASS